MNLIVYILKVSIAFILFYASFRIIFARFTFFGFNRYFILLASIGSFLLPLIKFPEKAVQYGNIDYSMGIDWDQFVLGNPVLESGTPSNMSVPYLTLAIAIYFVISVFLLFRSMRQYFKIRKQYSDGIISNSNGVRLIIHPDVDSPFTMFRTIYINRDTFEQVNSPIISHEMVHARQLHSVDLLISEIICAFLWFNPFVFLFKKQMRENHEYLADQVAHLDDYGLINYMKALSNELSRKYDPAFASYFQSSTLKKRIIMLTNKKSKNSKKFLYLLIIPLTGVLTMAFQQPADTVFYEVSAIQGSHLNVLQESSDPGIPSGFPLDKKFEKSITAKYGKMIHPIIKKERMHVGIDIAAPEGSDVYSTAKGIVVKSEHHEIYGNLIIIQHSDGYSTLYAHLNERLLEEGDKVKSGQKIAGVGNTGLSTGSHLHYEVRKDGENVDPAEFF